METQHKYFIEDLETQEWYRNVPFSEEPTIHTFGRGWNNPQPIRWTTDPLQALSFKEREDAAKFLLMCLEMRLGGNGWIIISDPEFIKKSDGINFRDIPKNIAVTEHIFGY